MSCDILPHLRFLSSWPKDTEDKLTWNVFFTWHSLRGRKKTVSFSERKRNDSEISTSDTTTDNNGRSLDTEVSGLVTWSQISEKVIYITGWFSRSQTLSAITRRRRRGAVCRVRGGAGRLALARWTIWGLYYYHFLFLRARQMMISISSCVENKHLCEIQKVQTCRNWGSRKMSSFL